MKVMISPPLDPARASFQTHLNYTKRLEHLLNGNKISLTSNTKPIINWGHIDRFRKLYSVTQKSIKKDVELAHEDIAFALIAAPWFPVKCYYALYYLESVLMHLHDGTSHGFFKGGHTAIRRKLSETIGSGTMSFSAPDLNRILTLNEIENMPAIEPGKNARSSYWTEDSCTSSVFKKLSEYKLFDAKTTNKWNLRKPLHRSARTQFMSRERMSVLDFFYWYRIKANYRDLDYIDFENGITTDEVLAYMEAFYAAYNHYRGQLTEQINRLGLIRRPTIA